MLCGISVICILTGKIAELMVYSRIRRMTGLVGVKLKNHIVICNWNGRAVAKISDSVGKGMCRDARFEEYIKNIFSK